MLFEGEATKLAYGLQCVIWAVQEAIDTIVGEVQNKPGEWLQE